MSRSSIDLRSELDPEDSISRGGISDERSRDLGNMDLDHSSDTPSTTTFVKPKTSNYGDYFYVKDDKYESNTKYLEGILGVFLSSLQCWQEKKFSWGATERRNRKGNCNTDTYASYDEAVNITTLEPVCICKECGTSYEHPRAKPGGSKGKDNRGHHDVQTLACASRESNPTHWRWAWDTWWVWWGWEWCCEWIWWKEHWTWKLAGWIDGREGIGIGSTGIVSWWSMICLFMSLEDYCQVTCF